MLPDKPYVGDGCQTFRNGFLNELFFAIFAKTQVLLGGGQDAMNVTTTGAREGHFEIRFWHRVFEEELSRAKGGFGPCNTLAVHPQGTGYTIGGEDGYIRVHQ